MGQPPLASAASTLESGGGGASRATGTSGRDGPSTGRGESKEGESKATGPSGRDGASGTREASPVMTSPASGTPPRPHAPGFDARSTHAALHAVCPGGQAQVPFVQ